MTPLVLTVLLLAAQGARADAPTAEDAQPGPRLAARPALGDEPRGGEGPRALPAPRLDAGEPRAAAAAGGADDDVLRLGAAPGGDDDDDLRDAEDRPASRRKRAIQARRAGVSGPAATDDERVRRFVGALVGGAVGLAALAPVLVVAGASCGAPVCALGALSATALALTPLLGLGGAWLGHTLLGGEAGLLVPAAALVPGALVTFPLLALAASAGVRTPVGLLPYLLTGAGVLAFSAAWGLYLRDGQLGPPGVLRGDKAAPGARVGTTVGAGLGVLALGGLVSAMVLNVCSSAACATAGAALAIATVGGALWAQYGLHRAMGGRGTGLALLAGMGLATLVGLAVVPAALATGGRIGLATDATSYLGVAAALVAWLTLPTVALKWSHAAAVDAEYGPALSVGAAPLPGGGLVSAGLRF